MDEESEYTDGDIVWVKLSYCWWPGEVFAGERLTDEFISTLKRKPLVVVKFFDEDSYEFVKNNNFIYKYNCNRKHEFLRKGLEQYRAKNKHMEKFPADVMHAERATGGDPNIVNSHDFLPQKRESYASIFQTDKSKSKLKTVGAVQSPRPGKKCPSPTKSIPVIPVRKHEVRILAQATSPSGIGIGLRGLSASLSSASSRLLSSSRSTLNSSLNVSSESSVELAATVAAPPALPSNVSPSQIYHCHKCGFESSRQNVIVLHTKYCRAIPTVPVKVPAVKVEPKAVEVTPELQIVEEEKPTKSPEIVSPVKEEQPEEVVKTEEPEELVEVIQVIEPVEPVRTSRSRSCRTPRESAVTPKIERRRNRGRGKTTVPVIDVEQPLSEADAKLESDLIKVLEGTSSDEVVDEKGKEISALEDTIEKDSKGKSDLELKNELLADWSEDEQDEQDVEAMKESDISKSTAANDATLEKEIPVTSVEDASLDKSTESSPQITSPTSSGNTIKYRNIPKKQKREFIEVTNDQPVLPVSTIEKSSSESSISTAATCGETLSVPDKTSSVSNESQSERPISAKQRILDRATRGSSKSISGDEIKIESPTKLTAGLESQNVMEEIPPKNEMSCFDFKEEEEEEIVLNKSPRRSLSNRRDTSLELNTTVVDPVKEADLQEQAKKDAVLKNEIDSLLSESVVPALPELPKTPAPSAPSSSTETTPQSKDEIDRNRTLPPKERGKRIFKTRNKIIENEAIALEQSKAMVLDFVKKSHEEELEELREQQEAAEAKLHLESPTTTNDDSQESLASSEPMRFENSEFAAIKAKRTKFSRLETFTSSTTSNSKEIPQESAVSSSNETKVLQAEATPVSSTKDQLTLDSLEIAVSTPIKGRKGKPRKSIAPVETTEKATKQVEADISLVLPPEDILPKPRKKRTTELLSLDSCAVLDTPRSRRTKLVKPDEVIVAAAGLIKLDEELSALVLPGKQRKRSKKDNEKEIQQTIVATKVDEKVQNDKVEEIKIDEHPSVEASLEEKQLKVSKLKRSKHLLQRSADSTADLPPAALEALDPPSVEKKSEPEEVPAIKQQPIKMIIKSKGKKSNSELICEPVIVQSEPKDEEIIEKLPKSPKSSKRKKISVEERQPETTEMDIASEVLTVSPPPTAPVKSPKSKRSRLRNDLQMESVDSPVVSMVASDVKSVPSATDLQIAETLINLPEVTPRKSIETEKEVIKPDSSALPVTPGSATKTINPRKRHLQNLLTSTEITEQPKIADSVIIPEKKKRDTVEVVSVATAVSTAPTLMVATEKVTGDDDKFDIDNIPIVMDDSELLEDSTISTTINSSLAKTPPPAKLAQPTKENDEDDVKLVSTTKSMTKKIIIVKNSNGSAKIVSPKASSRDSVSPKKSHSLKSTTTTVKPPVEQLSPKPSRSPAHSPPIRSTQLVQASSGGQIVITSKGTVLTTQSPATTSVKSQLAASSTNKTEVTSSVASSICTSASTISSSTSKAPVVSPPTVTNERITVPNKSPPANKISVQSQEVLHHSPKSKPKLPETHVAQRAELPHKKATSSTSFPKKLLAKKHADLGLASSSGKPLFSTSKGAPITPQPATSSAVSPGKKGHRVIKISPQKLKEFTRLGMVEDKGQGKVLTASGMKKFRQEQQMLQQQQKLAKHAEQRKTPRPASIDEEPSTSTPTPPPSSSVPSEVVVAAAADSSVKEILPTPAEVEDSPEVTPAASSTHSPEKPASPVTVDPPEVDPPIEENEADAAAVNETEMEEHSPSKMPSKESVSDVEAEPDAAESSESLAAIAATEIPVEAVEASSNVQESSQLIAVPAENFGGPANLFYLCSVREEGFVPVNNELLYLDSSNQLVALPEQASVEDIVNQAEVLEIPAGADPATVVAATAAAGVADIEGAVDAGQQNILLNTQDGQQIILDQQSLMALAAGGDTSQLLTPDGQQILLQGSAQELLAALAVSQPGLGIVAAEGTQIIVAQESLIDLQDAPLPGEIIQVNPNTTVETNAVLTKPPIMSTVEVPTKNGNGTEASVHSPEQKVMEIASANLDESLAAVIGVPTNPNVPTSLELPITVTNPVIAKTTTSKINPIYPPTTAISTIGIDPAAVAVVDLPTVAQTDSLTSIKSIWD